MSYRKIILILCLGVFLSAGRKASAQTTLTFNYTGVMGSMTVPSCVDLVTVTVEGAQGGLSNECINNGYYKTYEQGGIVIGTMSVSPGQVLNVFVGGLGANGITASPGAAGGFNGGGNGAFEAGAFGGGGGGGASDIRVGGVALVNRVVVGGGGGGEAYNYGCGTESGGSGGNLTGQCGLEDYVAGCGNPSASGGGGTQGSGGVGGYMNGYCTAPSGTLGVGGAGGTCANSGGGGGGGYYGGGGGVWGGGGGGSNYVGGLVTVAHDSIGGRVGNGVVIISYNTVSATSASGNVIANEICNGGATGKASAYVNGAPGVSVFQYLWTPSGQTKDTAVGLSAGIYTVTIGGCGSASATVTITQPVALSAKATVTANVLCNSGNNGSAAVTPSGGTGPFSYSWLPVVSSNSTVSGLSAGSYSVTVTDNCGASATSSVTVTQPVALTVKASVTANVSCHGLSNGSATSVVSNGTAPYTYSWSNGGTNASISNLTYGTYALNVVDNNGCTTSAVVTISQPAAVLITGASTTAEVLCNGQSTGSISSSSNGGTSPYVYTWSNGGTSASLTGLSVGTYSLTLTDAHGCKATAVTTITQPTAVTVLPQATFDDGHCNGSAYVMVNGGVTPYTYAWTPGASVTAYDNGICSGQYCCTITDAQGCSQSVCANVESDAGIANISATEKITVYPNPNSGQFTITSSAISGTSMVEIYNVLGEKVYTTGLDATKGANTTINISNQPNGIYLYRVISNDNGSLVGEGKIVLVK